MAEHTPTPWMTSRAGEMLPDDWMIVADMGKTPNGIQQISTVARALSIRQTPEATAANAAFIVKAVNSHDALEKSLDEALGIIHDLLGLELGSGERAMKFLDDHTPTANDVRGLVESPGLKEGS